MSRMLNSVSKFMLLLANGMKRFYAATFFSVLVFGITIYLINMDQTNSDLVNTLARIIMVSLLGLLTSILFTLVSEKYHYDTKLIYIINAVVSTIIPVIWFFFLLTDFENRYQQISLLGVLVALGLVCIYYANKISNEEFSIHFSYLIKILFTAAIVSLIVMLGLFLCTAAIYFLIYRFDNVHKIYTSIVSFSWIVLCVNLFLAMLPKKEEDYIIPKFFKVVTLYTALPVYIGLVLILYIYLGKILVTHKFPSGQLNWFASFASLIGIFLFLALRQYYESNTFVRWFTKLIGYVLLPIIAMQCIAFNIRYLNYGLTSARYVSMILIIVAIITSVITLIKGGKYVPYVLFLTALFSVVITSGPLNFFTVPLMDQESRLVELLQENVMLENNKIIAKPDINEEARIKITSAYEYIVNDDIKKSELLKDYDFKTLSFKQVFGFEKEYEKNDYRNGLNYETYVHYNSQVQEVDITGYSFIININSYYKQKVYKEVSGNVFKMTYNEKQYTYDLSDFIKGLYGEYGNTDTLAQDKLIIEQDNTKLVISNISFSVNENTNQIKINNIDGYILVK